MVRAIILSGVLSTMLAGQAVAEQLLAANEPDTNAKHPGGWELVWSDEFDEGIIDGSKWGFDVDCWGGGNEERQCYTSRPENAFVADGFLNIVARRENAAGPAYPKHMRAGLPEAERDKQKAQPFTSARLTTKGKADWLYGRFEVRARLPSGQGTWAAVWMLPTEEAYGAWAASGEIDIMEAVNLGTGCDTCPDDTENRIYGTIHYGNEWPRNKYKGQETGLSATDDGFHVFAVEWREGEIKWFVDGELYSTLKASDWSSGALFSKKPKTAPFDRPFYLILNLAIGGHLAESKNEGGVSLEGYPKALQLDWVRVYQRPAEEVPAP